MLSFVSCALIVYIKSKLKRLMKLFIFFKLDYEDSFLKGVNSVTSYYVDNKSLTKGFTVRRNSAAPGRRWWRDGSLGVGCPDGVIS